MSSVRSSDITSSNQVRNEDEHCNSTETLNKSEVLVVSSKKCIPRPAFELGKIAESVRKNRVELIVKSNCLVGGSLKNAARVGDIKLVKLRIRQGADVNDLGRNGRSPLHVAAAYGYPEIIELLINNGARLDSVLNGPTKNGYTPLHIACFSNKIKCVKVLLKYGASVTPKCSDVHHPIHIAVFKNHVEVAALLLDHGADVNLRYNNKFFHNKWDQSIFWKDMDLTLLHYSIARQYKEMTALLLERGADIHLNTRSNKTSLMHAVEANDLELVKSFLAKGANPNDRDIYGEPVLFYIVVNAYNQSIYYNKQEFYSEHDRSEVFELLIAAKADLNARFRSNGSFNSLLFYMCMYGRLRMTYHILGNISFDWRNIDVATIKVTEFRGEAISPNDEHDEQFIAALLSNFCRLKTSLFCQILSRHMMGFPLKQELLSAIHSSKHFDKVKSIEKYFKEEIRYVKQTTIGNTKISLSHLLTCKMTELVRLSFHKDFRNLCLKDYLATSRYYHNMIENRWNTAVKRSTSIVRSSKIMFDLFSNHLPYDCCETIASFLNDKELDNFIKNCS
ncbi:putative ankyrin repeat protein RF_0381, partial [Microplitis mediator]|uniref:putative ankyrin repeat protein RF_0381 n=1 Tax=Microplitis mediator TaxID=375433 RepID=UPI002553C212